MHRLRAELLTAFLESHWAGAGVPPEVFPASLDLAAGLIYGIAADRSARASTVVLMVDGVGFDQARGAWPQAQLQMLVSTFPTTSTTAWLTAMTGTATSQHLVPGMAYRVRGRDVLAVDAAPARLVGEAGGSTGMVSVYSRLRRDGIRVVVLPGKIGAHVGPWSQALWGEAEVVTGQPHVTTPSDPRMTVADVVVAVERQLRMGPIVIVAYVDIDAAVHREGYSRRVSDALRDLEEAALVWQRAGVATVAVSDHGAVPVEPDDAVRSRFDAVLTSGLCAPVAGGAGRVRWLYPAAGTGAEELGELLRAAIGDVAWVGTRVQAVAARMFPDHEPLLERVGSVVAVAVDPRFPVPDARAQYEHGGPSPEEACVPFAVW